MKKNNPKIKSDVQRFVELTDDAVKKGWDFSKEWNFKFPSSKFNGYYDLNKWNQHIKSSHKDDFLYQFTRYIYG